VPAGHRVRWWPTVAPSQQRDPRTGVDSTRGADQPGGSAGRCASPHSAPCGGLGTVGELLRRFRTARAARRQQRWCVPDPTPVSATRHVVATAVILPRVAATTYAHDASGGITVVYAARRLLTHCRSTYPRGPPHALGP